MDELLTVGLKYVVVTLTDDPLEVPPIIISGNKNIIELKPIISNGRKY